MLQINLIIKRPKQVKEIAELLIKKKLIIEATVLDSESIHKGKHGNVETIKTKLLIGRTRGLFLSTIEDLLKDKYGDKMPVIYGIPVINTDLELLSKLKKT